MIRHFRVASLFCALSIFGSAVGISPVAAVAQTQGAAQIVGTLVDSSGGVPIGNATVSLYQGNTRVAQVRSNADGTFSFPNEPAGIYQVEARAQGYQSVRSNDITAVNGTSTTFRTTLARVSGNGGLREIGRVSASGGRSSISTSTTISSTVSSETLQKQGYNRIGDYLNTLPGANITGNSSSVGDDQGVDIRGYGSDETETLIDGHPIGPQGPGSGGFSGQVSPYFAIGETRVTFGSGALGLYGTDSIGGTIDQETVNPTRTPHAEFTEGIGNQGKKVSSITSTGTIGRLGYAIVSGVLGTYGPWKDSQQPQPGLLGNDISAANLAANTYAVSQNYLLRNDLLKLRYQFDDKTQLTLSGLSATSWNDKSGNGDNCYFTYDYQLYKGQQIAGGGPNTFPATPTDTNPALVTCNGSVAVNTNTGPACITPTQYAQATYGLAGGGAGPWQSHRVQDYHARLTRQVGNNLITLDGFKNRYTTDYNRSVAGGTDVTADGTTFFTGGFHSNFYDTTGILVSDDIATEKNDLGFGAYLQHQRIYGDQFIYSPFAPATATSPASPLVHAIEPLQDFGTNNSNFFIRDEFQASKYATYYLNAWLKRSTVTGKTTFDPRLSLVYHTSPSDVVRITGGRSDGEPSPTYVQGIPQLNTTPTNITPSCGGLTGVGDVSNKNLQPETSNDLELGYGHRFNGDTIIQVNGYFSYEKNRIFGGVLPISATGAPVDPFLLAQYFDRISKFCGTTPTLANLEVNTNYNAASTRYQGLELSGRHRFSRNVYADYSYDIQSAVNLGIPDALLQTNATLRNGSQINNIPLHKGGLGIDFSDNRNFEIRTDVYYLSDNNVFNRPAFFYGNANASYTFNRIATLNLGVQNVFGSAIQRTANFGSAPFVAENQFGTDTSALNQIFNNNGALETGLLPPQVTLSLSLRI